MKKIFIYEVEAILRKRKKFKDTLVNYVKLKRPEGLEEHWPKAGDIVNLYLPNDIFYNTHRIIGGEKDGIYFVDLGTVDEIKYDIKVENLEDEGLGSLLHLPEDISNEIKGLSKLTKKDVDLNKNLSLYFDIGNIISCFDCFEKFYEWFKKEVISTIKDHIKDIDVWVDIEHYGTVEVYMNEPLIEEVIDKEYNTNDGKIKFKGIKEEEVKHYRLIVRTNIYKKGK